MDAKQFIKNPTSRQRSGIIAGCVFIGLLLPKFFGG